MIKILKSENFLELQNLYIDLYKSMHGESVNIGYAVKCMLIEMEQPGYLAIGIFKDNKLVGVIGGYDIKDSFMVTIVVCKIPYLVKKLYSYVENYLILNNYKAWTTEAKSNIQSIAPKLGAKIDKIIYIKEL